MARDYAQLKVGIWSDPDWRGLTAEQQHAYVVLFSNPRLSLAGVLDWLPGRYTALAKGLTEPKFRGSVRVLERRRFVVIDSATSELLVRSHLRHSGLLKRGNMGQPLAHAVGEIASDLLQATVLAELGRLFRERGSLAVWTVFKEERPDLFERLVEQQYPTAVPNSSRGQQTPTAVGDSSSNSSGDQQFEQQSPSGWGDS